MKKHSSHLFGLFVGAALALCPGWSAAGEAAPAGAVPVPQFVLQTTVNDPSQDKTALDDTQVNTSIVDLGGGKLVAAFDDYGAAYRTGNHGVGYAWSNTGGITWTDAGSLPASPGGDGQGPILATNTATGAVYLAVGATLSIKVFKSTDAGHTFGQPVIAVGFPGKGSAVYAPSIAIDNFPGPGNGNIYVCHEGYQAAGDSYLDAVRSIDGGATYSRSSFIGAGAGGGVGCHIAVSPNHQVNMFFCACFDPYVAAPDNKIVMRRSNNFGATYGPEILVADIKSTALYGDVGLYGGTPSNSFAQAAINPVAARPYIYMVYNDQDLATPANKAEVYYVVSINNGATWSAPAKINDDAPGDQFRPTVAILDTGDRIMFGYYSRSHDPANQVFHRRMRYGAIDPATGAVSPLRASFQVGADTPFALGQNNPFDPRLFGQHDTIAAGHGGFSAVWSDNSFGNAFHANQPDVRFAKIATPIARGDLKVSLTATPPAVALGKNTTITMTASAVSGTANDVYLSFPALANQLVPLSLTSAGGQCVNAAGFISCSMGTIVAGASKSVQVTAKAVTAAGPHSLAAMATTSSADFNLGNNAAAAALNVSFGSALVSQHSSGNLALPIPVGGTIDVPITVPAAGTIVGLGVRVRLNYTYVGYLSLSLIAPTGQTVLLKTATTRGYGPNFGTGTNDCAGAPTALNDFYTRPLSSGNPPFPGGYKPEQPLMTSLAGLPSQGLWKLRVTDTSIFNTGTLGCVSLVVLRTP